MKSIGFAVVAGLLLLAPSAVAQGNNQIVFGLYYRCNQGQESRADEIAREVFGSVVQKHVDAGRLTGWLWLSHSQGGSWRRVFATVGTDLGVMMDARQQMVEEIGSQHADAAAELGSICPSHDDYIWTSVATSSPNPDAIAGATMSTYHACDRSREGRASQIFQEVLAPLYQKHMDMGHLASWGFYAHRSGGRFRRLETMSGADHTTLLNMQAAILTEAQENNPYAMQEFYQICDWHVDYMWNNATQQ